MRDVNPPTRVCLRPDRPRRVALLVVHGARRPGGGWGPGRELQGRAALPIQTSAGLALFACFFKVCFIDCALQLPQFLSLFIPVMYPP